MSSQILRLESSLKPGGHEQSNEPGVLTHFPTHIFKPDAHSSISSQLLPSADCLKPDGHRQRYPP